MNEKQPVSMNQQVTKSVGKQDLNSDKNSKNLKTDFSDTRSSDKPGRLRLYNIDYLTIVMVMC